MYCLEKPTSKEGRDLLSYLNSGLTYTVRDFARPVRKRCFMAYNKLFSNVDKFLYATDIISCYDRVEFCVTLRSLDVKPINISWVRTHYSHIHAHVIVKYIPSFAGNAVVYDSFGLHCNDDIICAFVEMGYKDLISKIFRTINTSIHKKTELICNEIARTHNVIICSHLLKSCVKSLKLLEKNYAWFNS